MKNLLTMIFLMSSYLLLGQQQSEQQDYLDLSLEDLMKIKVVTASQTEQKVSDAPATIYVVTEEQIHDRGYNYLDELLEDIPEIEIQRKSSSEYSNYYTIRGVAGNEKFLVMLDGVRINSVDATPHVVGLNYPLSNIKRVEVLLGPASALYGVNGFSGIINLFTKKGSDIKGVAISSHIGSFGTRDASLNAGFEKNGISFNVAGNIYHSDEPFFPKYYKNDFAWYDTYSQTGKMKQDPFSNKPISTGSIMPYKTPTNAYLINASVSFKGFELGYYRNSESHNSSQSTRPEYNIYTQDAIYKIEQETIYGRNETKSEDGKWTSNTYLAYSSFEVSPDSKFVNTFTTYKDGYKYAFNRAFVLREQIGYKTGENSSVIAGVNFQSFSALAKSGDLPFKFNKNEPAALQKFYYLGTNTVDSLGRDLTIYQDFYYINESNIGLFAQYQTKLAKIIEPTLTMRYDNNSRYGSVFNPRVGIVISPSDALKFKIIYSQAFLAPSPYLSYQHYGGFKTVDSKGRDTTNTAHIARLAGDFWHLTNGNLQPEQLRTMEFAASYVKNSVAISADFYYNWLTALITNELEFNQTFKGVNINAVERPTNRGDASTYGFTTKIDFHKQFGGLRLQSYVAYTYSDGKFDGAPLPYSAKNTIKAGALFKIGNFSIDPRVIYRTESLHGQLKDSNNNPLHNDAFALVNLFAAYKISSHLELNVKVRNLLDARYYNVSAGGSESFAATPQDPFAIYGGFLVKL